MQRQDGRQWMPSVGSVAGVEVRGCAVSEKAGSESSRRRREKGKMLKGWANISGCWKWEPPHKWDRQGVEAGAARASRPALVAWSTGIDSPTRKDEKGFRGFSYTSFQPLSLFPREICLTARNFTNVA